MRVAEETRAVKAALKRMLKDQQGEQWERERTAPGRREKGTPKKRRGESGDLETRYRLYRAVDWRQSRWPLPCQLPIGTSPARYQPRPLRSLSIHSSYTTMSSYSNFEDHFEIYLYRNMLFNRYSILYLRKKIYSIALVYLIVSSVLACCAISGAAEIHWSPPRPGKWTGFIGLRHCDVTLCASSSLTISLH